MRVTSYIMNIFLPKLYVVTSYMMNMFLPKLYVVTSYMMNMFLPKLYVVTSYDEHVFTFQIADLNHWPDLKVIILVVSEICDH